MNHEKSSMTYKNISRNCKSNWSSWKCRKNTSKMSSATWRRNTCTRKRKWSVFSRSHSSLDSSWRPSIKTQASLGPQPDQTTTSGSFQPSTVSCWSHQLVSHCTSTPTLWLMSCHQKQTAPFPCCSRMRSPTFSTLTLVAWTCRSRRSERPSNFPSPTSSSTNRSVSIHLVACWCTDL